MLSSRSPVAIALCIAVLAGCGSPPVPNSLPLKVAAKNGSAALEFGQWVLVFEGVPAGNAGASGTINLPFAGGSGAATAVFGPITVSQSWNGQQNSISVNGVAFKLTEQGKKLEFADQSFQVTNASKTILIGKDGKTREDTGN